MKKIAILILIILIQSIVSIIALEYFNNQITRMNQDSYKDMPVIERQEEKEPIVIGRIYGRWQGTASYYSEDGCIGCSPTLTMANGETFHDEGFTVAFNWLPLDTWVTVRNLETDDITYARITDTGGFNELDRIIDLSPAVKNAIGCDDLCKIEVKEVDFK